MFDDDVRGDRSNDIEVDPYSDNPIHWPRQWVKDHLLNPKDADAVKLRREYLRQMAKHRQQAEARARFIRLHPHARPGFILSGIPPWLLL
ncbi:hypothetical protein FOMPIDRAFT_1054868 [Fomitopsis schrenkii]|uniref:Uncharacterized protein n=1 Tax=Fomitopsis schrenkii TaxID=2126942 RepID=S8DU46_FOMSC|nr:hypothetical protein FOMPIDRAFT_1054868 [Fomitopsis schrenkii]